MKYLNQSLAFVLSFLIAIPAFPQASVVNQQSQDVNYILNGGFENSKAGWSAYKNTAQATPVTGTGTGAATTIASSTSAPIQGKSSGILTKTATNTQGEGVSYAFTLDSAAKGRVLTIRGLYQIISGTYSGGTSSTDSDIELYIYDVDAAQIIQPAAYKLEGGVSGLNYTINATFQTSTTSSNYRLVFHEATTSALAYSIKIDQIKIGAQPSHIATIRGPVGAVIYTGSATAPTGYLSADGSAVSRSRYARLFTAIGTNYGAGDGSTTFNLPNLQGVFARGAGSQTISGIVSSATLGATQGDQTQGHVHTQNDVGTAGGSSYTYRNVGQATDGLAIGLTRIPTTGPVTDGTNGTPRTGAETRPANVAMAAYICFDDGNVTMSSDVSGRQITARVSTATSQTYNNTQPIIIYGTVQFDKTGAYNPATGGFTCTETGIYRVSSGFRTNNVAAAGLAYLFANVVYKNGGGYSWLGQAVSQTTSSTSYAASGSTLVDCIVGDVLSIHSFGDTTTSNTADGTANWATFEKVNSGSQQIAASESVNAQYNTAAGQSLPTSATTNIVYETKEFDSHSAMNPSTGAYTAPASGTYRISTSVYLNSSTWVANAVLQAILIKNASAVRIMGSTVSQVSGSFNLTTAGSAIVKLVAGDTINVGVFQNSSVSITLLPSGVHNWVSIERVGN